MDEELDFNILDDLSDELSIDNYYHIILINELTNELVYKIYRRLEYYITTHKHIEYHESCCIQDGECFCVYPISVGEYICFDGDIELLKWMHRNKMDNIRSGYIHNACKNGHLEIIKWLHQTKRIKLTKSEMDFACSNGHIDVAKWLHANRRCKKYDRAMLLASQYGYLDVVKWLYETRGDSNDYNDVLFLSALYEHYNVTEWLYHNVPTLDINDAIQYAEAEGKLEVVEFLKKLIK